MSNIKLLRLTDKLADRTPNASARLLHGHAISFEKATSEEPKVVPDEAQAAPPSASLNEKVDKRTRSIEASLRTQEVRIVRLRRQLRFLRLERWSTRVETLFSLVETFFPHRDNQRMEALCGTLAATLQLGRIGGEVRWGE